MTPRFTRPRFFNKGMVVYIDCRVAGVQGQRPGTVLRCEVTAAHGVHARIENKQRGFTKLVHLDDVLLEAV